MNDKLIERADSLMRRRSFVAGANSEPAERGEAGQSADAVPLEEVPVLTEVVDQAGVQAHEPEIPETSPQAMQNQQIESAVRARLEQLLLARQSELAVEIETWLDEQMPQLVIRAMDGITDHLVALLANRARDDLLPRLENVMHLADGEQAEADDSE
ncbi:MAG: hypothetical protein HY847_00365 [Betaproteobacteria bacterium]|nr:hypothetical protein [Betaproteobacteria bacterium]